jgi:hypothetical protein
MRETAARMARYNLSHDGVLGPVVQSARMTRPSSALALRRFVIEFKRQVSRIASYSRRVGDLSASPS